MAIKPDEPGPRRDALTSALRQRQETLFARPTPLRLTVILTAGALTRPVGDPTVMAAQTAQLCALNRNDCIDIRVLPWEAGAHPAMHASRYTILDSHHDDDPAVVYTPTLTGAHYTEKTAEIDEYRRTFRRLYDMTVPIELTNGRSPTPMIVNREWIDRCEQSTVSPPVRR